MNNLLFLFVLLSSSVVAFSAHAEDEKRPEDSTLSAQAEHTAHTEEEPASVETGHRTIIPRVHVGLAHRTDFGHEPPHNEPFLVAGPGMLVHLKPKIGFMASLTYAMAPTGTHGPGLTTEFEFEIWEDHLALDLVGAAYTETNYNTRGHWDLILATGLGTSIILPEEMMLTVGVQGGLSPTKYKRTREWGWNIYPVLELAIPVPWLKERPSSH